MYEIIFYDYDGVVSAKAETRTLEEVLKTIKMLDELDETLEYEIKVIKK